LWRNENRSKGEKVFSGENSPHTMAGVWSGIAKPALRRLEPASTTAASMALHWKENENPNPRIWFCKRKLKLLLWALNWIERKCSWRKTKKQIQLLAGFNLNMNAFSWLPCCIWFLFFIFLQRKELYNYMFYLFL